MRKSLHNIRHLNNNCYEQINGMLYVVTADKTFEHKHNRKSHRAQMYQLEIIHFNIN